MSTTYWIILFLFFLWLTNLSITKRKILSHGRKGTRGFLFMKDWPLVLYNFFTDANFLIGADQKFEIYGDSYLFAFSEMYSLATRSPDNVQYAITTEFENFPRLTEKARKSKETRWILRFIGEGIFLADGEPWSLQRNVASKLFRKLSLEKMIPVFYEHGMKLCGILEEISQNGPVDVQDYFNRYTMDTFGVIGFGVELNSMDSENSFVKAFERVQEKSFSNIINPKYWFFDVDEEFDNYLSFLNDYVDSIIETRKSSNYQDKEDLISRFMSLEGEDKLSDKILRDIVMNFVIAGKDTTAQLLSWMCYNLSLHPQYYERLCDEIENTPFEYTQESIKTLKFLDAFLHETLRLFPSVPFVRRRSAKDNVFPDGTVILKEEQLNINIYSLHRHPKYWENPHEFDPDRWMGKSPIKHPYQYLPFHGGPMVCLGKHLATLEAKIMLILIVKHFTLELASPAKIRAQILLKSTNGVNLNLTSKSH